MSQSLAIEDRSSFLYGVCPHPVSCGHGVTLGTGDVIPEINFTLPTMRISDETWEAVRAQYTEMITSVLQRAVDLKVPQLLIEFETLPDMTYRPKWGLEINRLIADEMRRFRDDYGIACALRFTPNDIRESMRPPKMRQGVHWEAMKKAFAAAGDAGADLISIESTGGKEICDKALLRADLFGIVFALGVLGARDMSFLWEHIVAVCHDQGIVPAGDTACGFANTAMVLADRKMIPRVFAAIVRVASVPRSLVAYTEGAVGPSKDCAYEGPYLKAISGIPISMEGKSSACAHLSPVGNVAQAVCDAWSNESVQNVQLLSGKAPVVSLEQLAYDCRLMNTANATEAGGQLLSSWLADSDSPLDVQAFVLHPDVVLRLSHSIVQEKTPYKQTVVAVRSAIAEIDKAAAQGDVEVSQRELAWLARLKKEAYLLPETETDMIEHVLSKGLYKGVFLPEEYGISIGRVD